MSANKAQEHKIRVYAPELQHFLQSQADRLFITIPEYLHSLIVAEYNQMLIGPHTVSGTVGPKRGDGPKVKGPRIAISGRSTTGFRGVQKYGKRWATIVYQNGKTTRMGVFDTPELAARAYDLAARSIFGDEAILNFPQAGELSARDHGNRWDPTLDRFTAGKDISDEEWAAYTSRQAVRADKDPKPEVRIDLTLPEDDEDSNSEV